MKCMSCLGLVVRLNSFMGFNLAHSIKCLDPSKEKLKLRCTQCHVEQTGDLGVF